MVGIWSSRRKLRTVTHISDSDTRYQAGSAYPRKHGAAADNTNIATRDPDYWEVQLEYHL